MTCENCLVRYDGWLRRRANGLAPDRAEWILTGGADVFNGGLVEIEHVFDLVEGPTAPALCGAAPADYRVSP